MRCIPKERLEGLQRIPCYARWQSMESHAMILETANSTEGVKTCSFPMAGLLFFHILLP